MNIFRYFASFFCITLFISCGPDNRKDPSGGEVIVNDSRFSEYIKAHTNGTISRRQNITVQLADIVSIPDDLKLDELFDIEPAFKGSVVKTDPHTIVLLPDNELTSGEQFLVTLKLNALTDVPEELEEFLFRIKVIEQDYEVALTPVQVTDPANPDILEFTGTITTADFAENDRVEKMISLTDDYELRWQHLSPTSHRFAVTGIRRQESTQTLVVRASGNPIGVKRSEDVNVEVPSAQVFSVISTKVEFSGDPYISIYFSDPLDSQQDLTGLVQLDDVANPRLIIDGNELKLYVSQTISGNKKLQISEGIRNTKGKTLDQTITSYVAFEPEKPQVRLMGHGTILPSTDGLVLPFESVNLKAVQVEVARIYEENLPQFFQVNTPSGDEQLTRVGQKIWKKRISLAEKAEDLTSWNRFTLDMASLFASEKGALYQIRIGFGPEDTNYPCEQAMDTGTESSEDTEWSINESDGFDAWGNLWGYGYPNGYQWSERDNPCHVSYYNSSRFLTTGLLASDIGLIAKIGANNEMAVIATNMTTALPIQASITVLDYQLQNLGEVNTDKDGKAVLKPGRRPFLVIAAAQGQKSYLRLADNEALSMSNFDVSGTHVEGTIKGFIYGDRGVWRPGDDIFLSFMLEDKEDKIPADHPVVMELRDPKGNLKDRKVLNSGIEGLYTFKTKTSPDDITGNWWAAISVGNTSFSKTLKVETIKPNRLKIDLDPGVTRIVPTNRKVTANLNINWLTGLTGSNLKAETELRLTETNTTFEGYGQYEFDDRGKRFFQDPKQVFSGKADESGKASFQVQLPENPESPGALTATFNTKAFEPGGGFSIHSKSVTYLPYESFVGLNLTTSEEADRIERDQPQEFQIVTLDASGKPVNRTGVEFKLYKLNWRWWWDESDDYMVNYVSSEYSTLVEQKKINTTQGKGAVSFQIKSPEWGRFIAVVEDPVSGHTASKVFYTGWYGDSGSNTLGASSLQVSTDKEEYEVGEKITVMVKGSQSGQALVSIENGSALLQSFWVKAEKSWSTFSVPVTPEMTPNVYLHVTLLQPHGQTTNDLPIRLYGIAPVKVYDKDTRLLPQITMAEEWAPGEPAEIIISESSGKPMAYTLAVVDEGLLDITGFSTPAPWDHFYSKEAIGVKTWDLYDEVIGAYGGRLERLLAIGGGEGGINENAKPQEERFKPVVQFMGPFFLEKGKSKRHTFTMPQYIGSVKTMVVAGFDGAYGSVDKATPVVKPLMVLGTLPRVVGPGEKVSLPVNVFRYKDHVKEARVSIEASGVLSLRGPKSQTIELNEASGTLYFDLDVAEKPGPGKVVITGISGNEKATHEINILSRSPNAPQTITTTLAVEAGTSGDTGVKLFGMEGTNEVTLEIATIPPINLERRLQYLIRYPHGCIEQTISSAFPQLFLGSVTELTDDQKVKIASNVKMAIDKVVRFQEPGGGLSYWPGYSEADSWSSSYAYHFLIEAQKLGYMVPNELVDRLRNFQRNKARNWTKSVDHSNSDLIQAYRLFTLAVGGYPELGAMNRLRNTSDISVQSTFKLAAAYAVTGQTDAARNLMQGVDMRQLSNQKYRDYYYYYTYGSEVRDLAMLLETYVYMDSKAEAYSVLKVLSDNLSNDEWMSTQTTAYCLLAISKYVAANKADEGMKARIAYGSTSASWQSDKALYRSVLPVKAGETIRITNEGKSNLFATLTITGTPLPGEEPVQKSGLDIRVRYQDLNGRPLHPDSLSVGKSFDIIVTVKNEYTPGRVSNIALTHIIPSGWEIRNDRLTDQEANELSSFEYQDIRDDRVYTYFDLKRDESKTFKVSVTAAYPGNYFMPGVHAEAMYNAEIAAKTAGKWISIGQ